MPHFITNHFLFIYRRTFPLIKLRISGLDESSLYTVQVEFKISDQFKYRFVNGEWRTSPRNDGKSPQPAILYEHTDSPNFGHHWVKDAVAFGKLKLTNNEHTKSRDSVFLRSLNKYDPILRVFKHDKKNVDDKCLVFTKFFKQTQFIAVTAYQNEHITALKIKHNPFAKAFLNNKPTITIDSNDNVIITPLAKSEPQENSADSAKTSYTLDQLNRISAKYQPTETNQKQAQKIAASNQQAALSRQSQSVARPTGSGFYGNQDFIQNWYAAYYQHPAPSSHGYHGYPDSLGYPNSNQCFNPYAPSPPVSRDYFPYPSHQYQHVPSYQPQIINYNGPDSSQHSNQHQQLSYPTSMQPQFKSSEYASNIQSSNGHFSTEHPKQSSPIYDSLYSDNANLKSSHVSAMRSNQTASFKDNRAAPYSTSRPMKRPNFNTLPPVSVHHKQVEVPLSVSPVYNMTKLDFNSADHSDDSLNLTENFLSQLHNQTIQSTNNSSNASSSSFALSSTTSSN